MFKHKKKQEKLLDKNEALRLVEIAQKLKEEYNTELEKRIIEFIDSKIREAANYAQTERVFSIHDIARIFQCVSTDYYDVRDLAWNVLKNSKVYNLIYSTYTKRNFKVVVQDGDAPIKKAEELIISWKPIEEVEQKEIEDENIYEVTFIHDYKGYGISNKETGDKNRFLISRIKNDSTFTVYNNINIKSKKGLDYFESVEEAKEYIDNIKEEE